MAAFSRKPFAEHSKQYLAELGLGGMRSAFEDILAAGVKCRHPPPRIVGELPEAEIARKKARSINCQLAVAKLPSAKDPADFDFSASPVNEAQLRGMAEGGLLDGARNAVLVGGTGTGKSHLAAAVPGGCIRNGDRGRFVDTVNLADLLEAEVRDGRQGRLAEQLVRRDLVVLDELGYLPFARTGGQLLFHLLSRPVNAHRNRDHQPVVLRMAVGVRRREDGGSPAGPARAPLRDRRDRERELALPAALERLTWIGSRARPSSTATSSAR